MRTPRRIGGPTSEGPPGHLSTRGWVVKGSLVNLGSGLVTWSRRHRDSVRGGQALGFRDACHCRALLNLVGVGWAVDVADYNQFCIHLAQGVPGCRSIRQLRGSAETAVAWLYSTGAEQEATRKEHPERLAAHGIVATRFVHDQLLEAEHALRRLQSPTTPAQLLRASRDLVWTAHLLGTAMSEFALSQFQLVEFLASGQTRYRGVRNPTIHTRAFYEVARQAFYRDVSTKMFYDRQPDVAVAGLLRAALELQLRRAFGVVQFVRRYRAPRWLPERWARLMVRVPTLEERWALAPEKQSTRFINVSDMLAVASSVDLRVLPGVPGIGQIRRFYGWANLVLHGGRRPTIHETWFALEHLRPLLRAAPLPGGGWTSAPVEVGKPAAEEPALRGAMRLGWEWEAQTTE